MFEEIMFVIFCMLQGALGYGFLQGVLHLAEAKKDREAIALNALFSVVMVVAAFTIAATTMDPLLMSAIPAEYQVIAFVAGFSAKAIH